MGNPNERLGDRIFAPIVAHHDHWDSGITLREWYAGIALQGMISRAAFNQEAEDIMKKAGITPDHVEGFMASLAFDFAEAMLKESEKRSKG